MKRIIATAMKVVVVYYATACNVSEQVAQVDRVFHGDRDSLRVDIPKDKVPPASRRLSGRKYFFIESPQFMDAKPAISIMEGALAAKGKAP